jgi:glycosyltransferase involved in cell wall biosynthesis
MAAGNPSRAMKASVSLITYNHAPFIAQAIESVLMQQTEFEFELLIGEDDSTDGTREIVKSYQAKHPDKIRLLLNDRKNVVYVNGKPTGQWNFVNNIRNTRGQYVALLDGDDYWTSPLKLQKQVAFLETNPDCALCFHNVRILDESDPGRLDLHHAGPMRGRYDLEDLLTGNFMHTCSVVFRARLFDDFPAWIFKCAMGDWPLHVLNAQHGRIGYLDEVMGVYRKHSGGVWSGQERLRILANTLQAAEHIGTCLTPDQRKHLDAGRAHWHREMIELYGSNGDRKAAVRLAASYFKQFLFRTRTEPWRVLRRMLLSQFRCAGRSPTKPNVDPAKPL